MPNSLVVSLSPSVRPAVQHPTPQKLSINKDYSGFTKIYSSIAASYSNNMARRRRGDIVLSHIVVCLFVCLLVCLSGSFANEGVELDSLFLVGKLMVTPEGAK